MVMGSINKDQAASPFGDEWSVFQGNTLISVITAVIVCQQFHYVCDQLEWREYLVLCR
jgi:hypothetical protein